MFRKITSFLLAVCLMAACLPVTAAALPTTGSAGDRIAWTMQDDGTLVFSGSGRMDDNNQYTVKDWSMYYANDVKQIVFEEGITYIGKWLFASAADYIRLESVTIPASVTEIGEYAFNGLATYLEAVYIRDLEAWCAIEFADTSANPLNCGADLYVDNLLVEKLVIPGSISSIADYTFKGCTSMTCADISASVTSVGSFAFNSCPALEKVVFRGNAPEFGQHVFTLTSTYAYYPENNATWTTEKMQNYGGTVTWIPYDPATEDPTQETFPGDSSGDHVRWTMDENTGTLIIYGAGKMEDFSSLHSAPWMAYRDEVVQVIVEEGVTGIGDRAFYDMNQLTDVFLPSTLESIGSIAFSRTGLSRIEFPETLTNIGAQAFDSCHDLEELVFHGNAPVESYNCFYGLDATAYYPGLKDGWTEEARAMYGGTIEWVNTDHTHEYGTEITAPTCAEQGFTTFTCGICGDTYTGDFLPATGEHIYDDEEDTVCNVCGENYAALPVYRLYNPYTHEHLMTSGEQEKHALLSSGWTLDGVAWNAPKTGISVYRLYNPYDDWHTYTTSETERDTMMAAGWTLDGVVSAGASEENGKPIYRLFNPYVTTNFHLFTASTEERDLLVNAGWVLEGVAWYALK